MFSIFDLIHFDNVVKKVKWRKAMDAEISLKCLYLPHVRLEIIRLVVSLAAQQGRTNYQLDVKSTFSYVS